jgi:O-antigen/teichoic acid export membrane protein
VLKFSVASFREQFRFGSKVFLQGLLESIFREINSLVVGKSYHTTALGNYSRGQKFYELFIIQTGTAFNKVLYPTMAGKTDESTIHKSMYTRTYSLLFFVMAPLCLFLYLLSDPIVRVLLTDKWLGAIPVMKLYFTAGAVVVLMNFNATTILSANQPKLFLKMDVVHKILMGIALVATFKISIEAIILGWLIVNFLYYIVSERIMYQLTYYSKDKYIKMLHVLVCLVPCVLLYLAVNYMSDDHFAELIINIVAQPLIYLFSMKVCGFPVYSEFTGIVKPMLPKRLQFIL